MNRLNIGWIHLCFTHYDVHLRWILNLCGRLPRSVLLDTEHGTWIHYSLPRKQTSEGLDKENGNVGPIYGQIWVATSIVWVRYTVANVYHRLGT